MKNHKESIPNKYADIINLPHHISITKPQMAMIDRAAQFSPFAALTGYDEAIVETERLTDSFIELDENRKSVLNEKLQFILDHIIEQPKVTITYFQPDIKKGGGSYVRITEAVKKIDEYERSVSMINGTKILINFIYNIEIE